MRTYKYHFPADGRFDSPKETKEFVRALTHYLNHSGDCLGSYAMFPSDSEILDKVTIDVDETVGLVEGVNLYTYTELFPGNEGYLKDCVEENLKAAAMELYDDVTPRSPKIEGDVQGPVIEGELPKTLYHIAEHEYVDIISREGIDPQDGGYGYMNDNHHVYMSSKEDMATWLAILKNNEHPVIMEIDTEQLGDIKQALIKDRGFKPDGYVQYSTSEFIPASAIKETELTPRFCAELLYDVNQNHSQAITKTDKSETLSAYGHLDEMGIFKNATVEARAEVAIEHGIPEVGMDEEDAVKADIEAGLLNGDDFTKAVNGLDTPALGPILD